MLTSFFMSLFWHAENNRNSVKLMTLNKENYAHQRKIRQMARHFNCVIFILTRYNYDGSRSTNPM